MKKHTGGFMAFVVGIIVLALLCGTGWFAAQALMNRNIKNGQELLSRGDYSEALDAFKKADKFSLRPNTAAVKGMADAYIALGDYSNAKGCYEKLIKLEPKDAKTHYTLGLLYIRVKNYEGAEKEITALRELGGDEGVKYADELRSKMEVGKVKGFFQDLIKKVVPSLPDIPGLTDNTPVKPDAESGDSSQDQN